MTLPFVLTLHSRTIVLFIFMLPLVSMYRLAVDVLPLMLLTAFPLTLFAPLVRLVAVILPFPFIDKVVFPLPFMLPLPWPFACAHRMPRSRITPFQ